MSLRYLLDTNIVSVPMTKAPDPEVLRKLVRHGYEAAIGAVVWHELVYGVDRLPKGKRRTAYQAYLGEVVRAAFPILPYDEAAAAWHGRERSRLEAEGKSAPFADGQLAAIAHTQGLVLVTRSKKDFERYRELEVEAW